MLRFVQEIPGEVNNIEDLRNQIRDTKNLKIFPNVCNETESVAGLVPETFDNVVRKHFKKLESEFDSSEKQRIELDRYFKKGFFYKGPRYDLKNPHSFEGEISVMKDVKAENGLFKIEIENRTYPHSGYVYLDLARFNIVNAEWV